MHARPSQDPLQIRKSGPHFSLHGYDRFGLGSPGRFLSAVMLVIRKRVKEVGHMARNPDFLDITGDHNI